MSNIWFLRTDKDNYNESIDISIETPFIYSLHGICRDIHQENVLIQEQKKNIFPELRIKGQELRKTVRFIKEDLIKNKVFADNGLGKKQCDLFIYYWVAVMQVGDIVFVRNKKQEVFICEITGYVLEEFFDNHGGFQRPVKILERISSNLALDKELSKIWHRTLSRRTLEKNSQKYVSDIVFSYINQLEK